MRNYERLKDMITDELDRITNKGELSSQSLEMVDKLTHSLKSIETIQAMDEFGDEYSGRGRKRDSMGRYSSDRYAPHYGSSYGYEHSGRYSRDDAKHEMMEHLRDLEMSAPDERTRRMVQEWKKQAERE